MFSVSTNFDNQFIQLVKSYDVFEVYGKLSHDVIGGCRPSFLLKNISRKRLELEVKEAHENNIEFNYILNANTLNNIEYTKKGMKKILNFINFLCSINVDSVTVTIPYLVILIKKNFPAIKVDVSTVAFVDSIKKFQKWKDLGVNNITLSLSANRDFELLKSLARYYDPSYIKLIVNQGCEMDCIFSHYHASINSSQSNKNNQNPIEYCSFSCKKKRTENLRTLLCSQWIRPEDLSQYNKLGFNKFKIVQRQDSTERLVRTVKAYCAGSYDGNLLDIVNLVYNITQQYQKINFKTLINYFRYFFKPFNINLIRLYKMSKLVGDNYDLYIDNKKLDGFLVNYPKDNCKKLRCDDCLYCDKWVDIAIKYDSNKYDSLLKRYDEINSYFLNLKKLLFQ